VERTQVLHPALRAAGGCRRQGAQLLAGSPRAHAVGEPAPPEVSQQPGREFPSANQGPAQAGPTVLVGVRQHSKVLSAASPSDQPTPSISTTPQAFSNNLTIPFRTMTRLEPFVP
jgi:hypothetical protein